MAQNTKSTNDELSSSDNQFLGITLALIGVMVLLLNLVKIDAIAFLILPTLGVLFVGWGFYTRRFGFTIPGCILTSLGVALFVSQQITNVEDSGGIFVLALSIGFVAIAVLAVPFRQKNVWWPLIPGAILGVIGIGLLIGGDALKVVDFISKAWPVLLVAIGLYILFAPRERKE
jgi:hypothetical protein